MAAEGVFQGSLFSSDFLNDAITRIPDWKSIQDSEVAALAADLRVIYDPFPKVQSTPESQTEDDLIWPILTRLGWAASLRQQNLAARGRDDVPDGLLFQDSEAKAQANAFSEQWKRYGFGLAIVESKRWARQLDRQSGRRGEETAPSTQMLRYLRRVEDLTTGKLRWGILTNGARWRLYYQGARSVSEQFFDIDLPKVLAVPGFDGGLFALSEPDRALWLKVFVLVFRRDAFLPTPSDPRTFHQRALEEGRYYEERVAANLSNLVFGNVYPGPAKAIAAAAPSAPLLEVRQATLIVLYRLLFILYAEDRDLLPVRDPRYDDYGLREKVRADVGRRKDRNDVFSATAARYWSIIDDLCRAIDQGDTSIGLPPYNGGLFDRERTPLLTDIRLGDAVMANVIDALSFERTPDGRKYINYRDLSVQQLGSIYERLLEHELVVEDGVIAVRPNVFARKGSGSYYTPDDLVALIIRETIGPLVDTRMNAFIAQATELEQDKRADDWRLGRLSLFDPADKLLDLKICDPAMGSGHFLVSLVDYLTDQVIRSMAEAEALVTWGDYISPLTHRIAQIRTRIYRNAQERGWTVGEEQLDDRHIVRRMILKRCVYGVDKNIMAVELAKVALWLHTFTVGAPLSFLDHHLRRGDSLFGSWVRGGIDKAAEWGAPLLLHGPMTAAMQAAAGMQVIEGLTDAEIAEAHLSKDIYDGVLENTGALNAFLSLIHAFDWLKLNLREDRAALTAFFDGQFGDPVQIALGKAEIVNGRAEATRFAKILVRARILVAEENFLNWQVAFPGIWSTWESSVPTGGFDAVIGNPPWDRIRLEQVEWFGVRRPAIAMAVRASDRARMISAMTTSGDQLALDYAKASERAETAVRVARDSRDYPLLSGNDVNIYSLFVERAMRIAKPEGMVGLLTPSGIASDKTAAPFFKAVVTNGHLKALYDFENKGLNRPLLFPDVHPQFKFCVFIASPTLKFAEAKCAFFLQNASDLLNSERYFSLSAANFARLNPNTGTAPIFRTPRDAILTTAIYGRLPVLVDRSSGEAVKDWPVRYSTTFHMTNDSGLFRTRQELEEREGAYLVGGNRFRSPAGIWVPLYEGKMIWHFDHRAASVLINDENQFRAAYPIYTNLKQHRDCYYAPTPQYWVLADRGARCNTYTLAFRDVTNPTDRRTFDCCIIPHRYAGNTLPILMLDGDDASGYSLLCANFNAILFDYICRQKVQKNHLNWYIVEQLPVIPPNLYDCSRFGSQTAAEIIRPIVLELTYTATDMAPFARDMGYVDETGAAKPPFIWDEERRLTLRAKLDAVYFHLYGVTDRDDVRYIYSTFPIVEREEIAAYGRYRSRDLCLAYMNALAAGDPDADIRL